VYALDARALDALREDRRAPDATGADREMAGPWKKDRGKAANRKWLEIHRRYELLAAHLDERSRRYWLGTEALAWVKISQVRTLSTRRLGRKIGRVFPEELEQLVEGLNEIIAAS
jgi:hypothetical protein